MNSMEFGLWWQIAILAYLGLYGMWRNFVN